MKSKRWAAAGALALVVGGFAAPAPAMAVACGPNDFNYKTVGDAWTFTRANGTRAVVSGDPGVTLTISTTTTYTVGGTLGGNTQVSASIVILTIQQQLNYSITASLSGTTANSGSWTVPNSYTNGGRLEIGGRKHSGAVQKYRAKPQDCSNGALLGAASYNAPEDGWYFKHTKL